ncbi:MAG: tetratricopeptide repeat protein [Lysobacter sp.]|nr:tetratricopeptide repeat protein [Lysobacter sp.]
MGFKRAGAAFALVFGLCVAGDASAQAHCEHLGAQAVAAERQGRPFWFRTYKKRRLVALVLAECAYRPEAERALATAIDDRRFARLSVQDRYATLSAAATNAWQLQHYPQARDLYRRVVALSGDEADDWYRLSVLERVQGDHAASARAMIHVIEHWPELLDQVQDQSIFALIHKLEPRAQVRLDLLQALYDANWQRKGQGADTAWYELALMRVDRGEADAARAAIRRISASRELILLRADRRFDGLVDRQAMAFDVDNAALREVELQRTLLAARPDSLQLHTQLSRALLMLGRSEEALALCDDALKAIADAPADRPPYADDAEYRVWLMNNRAIALRRLGRLDEALQELRRASERREGDSVNVSQILNLGDYYASLGRSDEALTTVAAVGTDINGYGRMVRALVELRAQSQRGDAAQVARALAYLREHRQEGGLLLLEGLLQAGRMDEAEQALLASLASASERADALYWLQRFREAEVLPGDRGRRARKAELIARERVQAAIAQVGRIESYGIHATNEMD